MNTRIIVAAAAALTVGAVGPASANYVRVIDPTRNTGGVAVGYANGDRAAEAGICSTGAVGPGYYYLWGSPSGPYMNGGVKQGCAGDAPIIGAASYDASARTLTVSVDANGEATVVTLVLSRSGGATVTRTANAGNSIDGPVTVRFDLSDLVRGAAYQYTLTADNTTTGPTADGGKTTRTGGLTA